MRIDLTLRGVDGRERDVAVVADHAAPFASVLRALRDGVGAGAAGDSWWSNGRPVGPDAPLGGELLRPGALLTPSTESAEPGPRLDVVGGVDAGRSAVVGPAASQVGRGGDLVSLSDPTASRDHVAVTRGPAGVVVRARVAAELDGHRLGPDATLLRPGAVLRVADTHLALADGGAAPVENFDNMIFPPRPSRRRVPWWVTGAVASCGVAVLMALMLGSPQYLLFAAATPVSLVAGARLPTRRRGATVSDADTERQLDAALQREARARRAERPDPAALLRQLRRGRSLPQRQGDDPALLTARIGLGAAPSRIRRGTSAAHGPAGTVLATPIVVDLRDGPLGIVAPRPLAEGVARWLVAQLAACAGADTIAIVAPADDQAWQWLRWLPHAQGGAAGWTVRVSYGPPDRSGPRETAICLAERLEDLGDRCARVAMIDGEPGTRVRIGAVEACVDSVSEQWADQLARRLAAATVETAGTPARCSLGEVVGATSADAVRERWRHSEGRAVAPIGRTAHGILTIDFDADGPHALVGGTTGAGKSALLRTLVLTLAASSPPTDVAFVLIDYKGGAAFADCAALPHVTAVVTDLDESSTRRALLSLRAEVRQREQAFAAAGVAELAQYRAAGSGPPLPRLFVVVDEFAGLAADLPDFLTGLTAVAQRGRSLGLHLVLATQRIADAVTPAIRANSALRIALRTTDAVESSDVVDSPAAASIPASTPGRAYVRRDGLLVEAQLAHGDEPAPEPGAVRAIPLGPWRRLPASPAADGAPSEAASLVAAICAAAAGLPRPAPPWQPPLPPSLPPAALPRATADRAVVGLVDRPREQRQDPLSVELAVGTSMLVVGAPRSGRTGALLAVAVAAAAGRSPDDLHLQVIDSAGDAGDVLADLPHTGSVVDPLTEPGLCTAVVAELLGRQRLSARSEPCRPAEVLLIDGWEAFARLAEQRDARAITDLFAALRLVGRSGLSVVITGGRGALHPQLTALVSRRVALHQHDRTDFALAGISPTPTAALPPGRGLLAPTGEQVQFLDLGPTRADRIATARGLVAATTAQRRPPSRLRALPVAVDAGTLPATPTRLPFGVVGYHGAPLALQLDRGGGVAVTGPAGSGRSTVLTVLRQQAARVGVRALLVAPQPTEQPVDGAAMVGPLDEPPAELASTGLVLVEDTALGDAMRAALTTRLTSTTAGRCTVVAARAEDLAVGRHPLTSALTRTRRGVLLRPGPLDGDLFGATVPTAGPEDPPGRAVVVGDFGDGVTAPRPAQLAAP